MAGGTQKDLAPNPHREDVNIAAASTKAPNASKNAGPASKLLLLKDREDPLPRERTKAREKGKLLAPRALRLLQKEISHRPFVRISKPSFMVENASDRTVLTSTKWSKTRQNMMLSINLGNKLDLGLVPLVLASGLEIL